MPYPVKTLVEKSDRGGEGVPVFIQDQTTDMFDSLFLQSKVEGLTLAADTIIEDREVTLTAGHGLTSANSQGHILSIFRAADNIYYQGEILSVIGDVVEMSPPMSNTFLTTDAFVITGNPNLVQDEPTGTAIDGSTTPVIFSIAPPPNISGDIGRLVFAITSTNEMDLTTFGGGGKLTIGITLRIKRNDGSFKNLFTYRDNFDFVIHSSSTGTFVPKAGNAIHGFVANIIFNGQENRGVTARLDGNLDEEIQIVISELMDDTNSGNIKISVMAQGSLLQD